MKLNLLSLAIIAVVSTSFAVPPKHSKSKSVSSVRVVKSGASAHADHNKVGTPGHKIRSYNEGYQPGL